MRMELGTKNVVRLGMAMVLLVSCLVGGLASTVSARSVSPSESSATPPPDQGATELPGVVAGDMVTIDTAEGGLGAVAPQPGDVVDGSADTFTGGSYEITVETLKDGTVTASFRKDGLPMTVVTGPAGNLEAQPSQQPATSSVSNLAPRNPDDPECVDDEHGQDSDRHWNSTMHWYWDRDSTPGYLDNDKVEADLRAAVTNITHENNNCDRPDTVSATASFEGYASDGPEISPLAQCGTNDGKSDIGWGSLNYLGYTCNWGDPRTASDVKLDNNGAHWTTGACAGQPNPTYYVEGITTHERGHTWNLWDLGGPHANLTMGGANGQCGLPDQKQTLGLGDMKGLEVNY